MCFSYELKTFFLCSPSVLIVRLFVLAFLCYNVCSFLRQNRSESNQASGQLCLGLGQIEPSDLRLSVCRAPRILYFVVVACLPQNMNLCPGTTHFSVSDGGGLLLSLLDNWAMSTAMEKYIFNQSKEKLLAGTHVLTLWYLHLLKGFGK